MSEIQRPMGYREPTDEQMLCLPIKTIVWEPLFSKWQPSIREGMKAANNAFYAVPLTKEEIVNICDESITELSAVPTLGADPVPSNWQPNPHEERQAASGEIAVPITLSKNEVPPAIESGTDPKGEAGATKCPLWLIPPEPMEETAHVHALGAKKYGPWNWRKNKVSASTYISAILRHLNAWRNGEDNDPESGRSHLAHIVAGCFILMDAALFGNLIDDRSKKL